MKRGSRNEISYTPQELKFKIFGKKICPTCKSKLILSKDKEYVGKSKGAFGSVSGRSLLNNIDSYKIIEYYTCEKCETKYTITDLLEKSNKDENN